MRVVPLAAITAALSIPVLTAYGNDKAVGALSGAALGALIGGPPGVLIGAGLGALVGSQSPAMPARFRERPVTVGEALPAFYVYRDIPDFPDFQYLVLNNRRVIVDRKFRRVVRIVE